MKKLDYLESLRGLAALVVVFAHYVVGFYPALHWAHASQIHTSGAVEIRLSGTPLNLLYNGDFSVCIFFVLSGFVLSYKFFQQRKADVHLFPLVVKRYFRLLVPVLFSISLAFILLRLSLVYNQPASALTKSSGWLDQFWQFKPELWPMLKQSFFGSFFRHQSSYNNVLWTMTYEFYGSLIVFGFIAFLRNHPRRSIAYILLMLVFHRSYYLAFLLGILLSDWSSSESYFLKRMEKASILLIAILAGLFAGSYPTARQVDGTIYAFLQPIANPRTWHILGAFLVMAAVLRSHSLQALLSKKPFVFLGKISFSLYILHFLIMGSLSCYLLLILAPHYSYHVAFAIMFCISLPLIMAVSFYTYKYIDLTGIRVSQTVYNYLLQKRTTSAVNRQPSLSVPGQALVPESVSRTPGDESR